MLTKLTNSEEEIKHICDFSRGVLNTRSTRSYPTLAPRPQICFISSSLFCLLAADDSENQLEDLRNKTGSIEWLGDEIS